ncbi:unnamed protein product [Prunus armeniaca]
MGMESWWSKFICVCSFILLLLNATHCFLLVQNQALGQVDECSALLQFKESFAINKSVSADPLAYPKVSFWMHEKEMGIGAIVVHGMGLSVMKTLAMLSALISVVAVSTVLSIPATHSSALFTCRGLTSQIITSISLKYHQEISMLSKLSTLDLSFNYQKVHHSIPLKLTKGNMRSLVQNLTNIKQLHLSWVDIYSTVPDILVNASSLTSLQLVSCGLNGEFPVGIFHLPNLEVLDVSGNSNLTGYFPNFNRSNALKKLNVRATNFSGMLPASMGNLHSLNFLRISRCHFYPLVPSSLGNLTQLNYLDMTLFNDNPNNNSTGQLVSEYSLSWIASLTNLYGLSLAETKFRGKFPSFVANLTQLSFLELSGNEITGQIPSWLMNLTQLTTLSLRVNNLQGAIPRSLFQLEKLKVLRLSYNKLSLQTITNLSATVPQLEFLELILCNLTEFPEFLKYQSELRDLYLSDNNIQGRIPKWVWNATRETLLNLDLSSNFLTGFDQNPINLPWQNLYDLDLGTNMLQGSLPIPPQSIRNYIVRNNHYSGEISPS